MIYEFVNFSDSITFRAKSDQVAFAVTLVLGQGKAGFARQDGAEVPGTFLIMCNEEQINAAIAEALGCDLKEFWEANKDDIADALDSFAYTTLRDRCAFDETLDELQPDKRDEWRVRHEDRMRTSMNKWVSFARSLSKGVRNSGKEGEQ